MQDPNPTWENRYQSAGTWQNVQIASVGGSNVPSADKKYEGMRVADAAKLAEKDPFDKVTSWLFRSHVAALASVSRGNTVLVVLVVLSS